MPDLFYLLNRSGITVDISTFSKACKQPCDQYLRRIYTALRQKLIRNNPTAARMLFPIDATVVSLTSKLFWAQGHHQVKLLNGVNASQGYVSECLIDFGQGHEAKFSDYIASMIAENGIGIMDRGFANWELLDALSETNTLFVVRIKNNMRTEVNHSRYRVIWFCDLESRTEFRLATNLPAEEFSNGEIGDIYGCRWQIELLWKFLKMHLKLDRLIRKSRNGVMLQIYMRY
jgi:putative transposase